MVKIKELNWVEGNPSRWDGYDVSEPMLVEFENGYVQIVGEVNMGGSAVRANLNYPPFEHVKRWAKIELENK